MPQIYQLSMTKEEWQIVANALTFTENNLNNNKYRIHLDSDQTILQKMPKGACVIMRELKEAIEEKTQDD